MKLAVVGSRGFSDYEYMKIRLDFYAGITEIVSGGASGADSLAEKYAMERGCKLTIFKPEYDKYPKHLKKIAPLVRNTKIVVYSDMVVAFWDGKSAGTADTIHKARKIGKNLQICLVSK